MASVIDKTCMIGIQNGAYADTNQADLDALVASIGVGQPILIHIHGGLVTADAAIESATDLKGIYEALPPQIFPIFPIWHTGFLETVQGDWTTIASSVFARLLNSRIAQTITDLLPHTLAQDNTVSLAGTAAQPATLLPQHWDLVAQTAATYLKQNPDMPLYQAFDAVVSARDVTPAANQVALQPHGHEATLISVDFIAKAQPVETAGLDLFGPIGAFMSSVAGIVTAVANRFSNKTDHGLQATIWEEVLRAVYVDSIGADVWGSMKTEAATACAPGAPMSDLAISLRAHNREGNKLFLVGHSAGSIMICELLDTLFMTLNWTGPVYVIFLAPAVDSSRFATALAAHSQNIKQFRMFTMSDAHERQDVLTQGILPDALANIFYPSSLLYFISGLLDGDVDVPVAGLDRFYRGGATGQPAAPPAVSAYVLDATVPDPRVSWSVTASPDPTMNTNSLHHGDFGHPKLSDGTTNTTIGSILASVLAWP